MRFESFKQKFQIINGLLKLILKFCIIKNLNNL